MNSPKRKPKPLRAFYGALLMGMNLALYPALTGCGTFGRDIVIHPLQADFQRVKAGETVTAQKDGALVSNYFLEQVTQVKVDQ